MIIPVLCNQGVPECVLLSDFWWYSHCQISVASPYCHVCMVLLMEYFVVYKLGLILVDFPCKV